MVSTRNLLEGTVAIVIPARAAAARAPLAARRASAAGLLLDLLGRFRSLVRRPPCPCSIPLVFDGFVNRDPCGNRLSAGTASGDETRPAGRFTRAMSLSDEYWDAGYEYSLTALEDAIGSVRAVGCDDRAVGWDEAASSFRRKPASNCSFAAA